MLISKTTFLDFLYCPKNVWLKLHKPELAKHFVLSEFEKHLLEQGNEVESYSRNLFPDGIEVVGTGEEACQETVRLMTAKIPTIFQATFIVDGFIARNDALVYDTANNCWDLYEVKGSNSLKENTPEHDHIDDLTFQASLLKRANIPVGRYFFYSRKPRARASTNRYTRYGIPRPSPGMNGIPERSGGLSHGNAIFEPQYLQTAIPYRLGHEVPQKVVKVLRESSPRRESLCHLQEISNALYPSGEYRRRPCAYPDGDTTLNRDCRCRPEVERSLEPCTSKTVQIHPRDVPGKGRHLERWIFRFIHWVKRGTYQTLHRVARQKRSKAPDDQALLKDEYTERVSMKPETEAPGFSPGRRSLSSFK